MKNSLKLVSLLIAFSMLFAFCTKDLSEPFSDTLVEDNSFNITEKVYNIDSGISNVHYLKNLKSSIELDTTEFFDCIAFCSGIFSKQAYGDTIEIQAITSKDNFKLDVFTFDISNNYNIMPVFSDHFYDLPNDGKSYKYKIIIDTDYPQSQYLSFVRQDVVDHFCKASGTFSWGNNSSGKEKK